MDRQPSDQIFDDIQNAARLVWIWSDLHPDYIKEKVDHVESLTNFKDNWHSIIGRMDEKNQRIFLTYVNRADTHDFLRLMKKHYRYVTIRDFSKEVNKIESQ